MDNSGDHTQWDSGQQERPRIVGQWATGETMHSGTVGNRGDHASGTVGNRGDHAQWDSGHVHGTMVWVDQLFYYKQCKGTTLGE